MMLTMPIEEALLIIFQPLYLLSLKVSEQELNRIIDEQETNTSDLVNLVQENETILDAMKASPWSSCIIFLHTHLFIKCILLYPYYLVQPT